ncbi:hypothetical protein COT40_00665 [Candidatus Peregrinibacteria bacterium CG08_land_8_20_14_0_20_41_10]|nr:MAG: hypothetical protein AUJ78_00120 [Candidatus Peregrinibacteria bacterium CG1_02_41_10]PIS32314.1 MAG: hypothetical protein COT40_00665 [Candidatus Peregrinibacteria bacterium CG08_land_8_20_14_0_20_41_10]
MKITIIGGGHLGFALAKVLAKKQPVTVWECSPTRQKEILKKIGLNKNITVETDLKKAAQKSNVIIFAVCSNVLEKIFYKVLKYSTGRVVFMIGSKGIHPSGQTFYEIFTRVTKRPILILSGPSYAGELSRGLPTAVVLAGKNKKALKQTEKIFAGTALRIFPSSDPIGVSLAGCLKNVAALGTGVLDHLHLGENVKAWYLVGVMQEIKKIVRVLDGKGETLEFLAGWGDLILTALGGKSRNYQFALGKLKKKEKVTLEGYENLKAVYGLIKEEEIRAPLLESLYEIFYKKAKPENLVEALRGER